MLCRWVVSGLVLLVSLVSVSGDGENLEQKVNNHKKKVNNYENFLERSDLLAEKLHLSQEELADHLGMGRTTLWGYRKGTRPITGKAWRKLETAEKEVGIGSEISQFVASASPQTVEGPPPDRISALEKQMAEMVAAMREQTEQIQKLLEQRTTSSPGHGRAVGNKAKNSA